jgi:predicted SAM-dependent methyltransferase
VRIIVGAGNTFQSGWNALRQSDLDLLDGDRWASLFVPSSVDAVLAEHVFEHLTFDEGLLAAQNCYRYLKPGGYLRIAVPDGLNPYENYYEWVRPGGIWNPDDHKVLYTYLSLQALLEYAGFSVRLLEWWDESGVLNCSEWSQHHGNVTRCTKHWYANFFLSAVVGAPYTSLVVDAFKEVGNGSRIIETVKRSEYRVGASR